MSKQPNPYKKTYNPTRSSTRSKSLPGSETEKEEDKLTKTKSVSAKSVSFETDKLETAVKGSSSESEVDTEFKEKTKANKPADIVILDKEEEQIQWDFAPTPGTPTTPLEGATLQ